MVDRFLIQQTDDAKDLPLPKYMSSGAAGMDLYANVETDLTIKHGEIALVKTGVKIALLNGFEAQIRPRSGLALKFGVTLLNTPGTIDADYRGEISVLLINHGKEDFVVSRGMRIAQMVIAQFAHVVFKQVETLPQTERNDGGFGHTGI